MTPLSEQQVAALQQVAEAWGGTSYALIGATALAVYLDIGRPTEDLDLTLAIDVGDYQPMMARLEGWTPDERHEHRWYGPGEYPQRARLDVLPVGSEAIETGSLIWPVSGHTMSVVGLDLAMRHAVTMDLQGALVPVAPLAVIALLKMVSYLDRPADRERDLRDLARVFTGYLSDDDDRRWEEPVASSRREHDEQSPYALGHEIARLAEGSHGEVVERFCGQASAHQLVLLQAAGPLWWQDDDDAPERCLKALSDGFARDHVAT